MSQGSGLHSAKALDFFAKKSSGFWVAWGQKKAFRLFQEAAKRVPAYKDFLKKNHVYPAQIKTWKDFQNVPIVTKKNYLRNYPLKSLCWDGTIHKPLVYTSTSGSTGEPFYFPRQSYLDYEFSIIIENFLRSKTDSKKTSLVIVCFGMGVWIGGLITYKAFELASQRMNGSVSIITPGINKDEIFNALRNLAPQYDEAVLIGYPPFIKDIIDESTDQKVNLRKIPTRFVFAAEAFNEKFRDYILKKTKVNNFYNDMLHIYGSADIGAMAFETGVSILIKRKAVANKKVFRGLFSEISKNPTLAQYNPDQILFESVEGGIVLTGDNALPLIRYGIGDHGGVFSYDYAKEVFDSEGFNLEKEAQKASIHFRAELPFVFLYERSDFSTKLYGAIMYPEHVREVLHADIFQTKLTGKFVMATKFDSTSDEYFEINLELKPNAIPDKKFETLLVREIVKNLLEKNSEYQNNYASIPKKVTPRIGFYAYGHPEYFKQGVKQKWVKK